MELFRREIKKKQNSLYSYARDLPLCGLYFLRLKKKVSVRTSWSQHPTIMGSYDVHHTNRGEIKKKLVLEQ